MVVNGGICAHENVCVFYCVRVVVHACMDVSVLGRYLTCFQAADDTGRDRLHQRGPVYVFALFLHSFA